MAALEALRARAIRAFDEEDPRHTLALETLWHCAFPGGEFPRRFERRSELWGDLGFQGVDPVTDLRGGGFVALEHLVKFVVSSRGMVAHDPTFPLAIASINCTAMLLRHFALHPTLHLAFPGAAAQPECSTAALHHLLELHHAGTDALQAIHATLLLHLAREWEHLESPSRTLLDFPIALSRAYRHLCDSTPPGWELTAGGTPRAWLHAVCARLQREPARGLLGEAAAHECCLHPGAALAVLLVLLRSLTSKPRHAVEGH